MENFFKRIIDSEIFFYGPTKGSFILPENGFFIWQSIQNYLNKKFFLLGIKNVLLPTIIPLNLIEKEKKHIKGFSPELFYVKRGNKNNDDLSNFSFSLRPTSEVVFYDWYSKILRNYRQLPFLNNQWCSAFRLEKNTFPFFRNSEFFWQEGHTIHENEIEAKEMVFKMMDIYKNYFSDFLFLSVICGKKSKIEKFAGALESYSVECILSNGYFIQLATSHYFGDSFCKAMNVNFQNSENEKRFPFSTSWGTSTRAIGALADSHFDKNGIIFPSTVSPYQIAIVPIFDKDIDFSSYLYEIYNFFSSNYRTKIYNISKDFISNVGAADKEGCVFKILIGRKEFDDRSITLISRISSKKEILFFDKIDRNEIYEFVDNLFKESNKFLFKSSEKYLKNTIFIENYSILEEKIKNDGIKNNSFLVYFCNNLDCEISISKKIPYYSIRCLINENFCTRKCIFCERDTILKAYFGKSY